MNINHKPVALIVLDGWGYREEEKDNAIALAKKPFFDSLWEKYPHSLVKASGEAVGLPEGQMGNSEVGHMTIGAGRPADTDLVRIDKAIASGEFDKNPAFISLFEHVKKFKSTLHVEGLVSPGGVHSHERHLYAFLRLAKKHGMQKVAIHVFTDGRDTAPHSGSEYLKELEALLDELNADFPKDKPAFFIATLSGRYYAMDRDNNWDRLAKAEQAIFDCKGNTCTVKPSVYLEQEYKKGESDELLIPTVCATPDGMGCAIKPGDGVFFFNFRADRARMLSEKMLSLPKKENIMFLTLTEYCVDFTCTMAFPPMPVETTLGGEISKAGLSQVRIAETEKFAHATYFLNCGREAPYKEERDILFDSRRDVKTYDLAPEMRAEAIAQKAVEEISSGTDFVFINFANADMVGHTANIPAIVSAVEAVDRNLEKVVNAIIKAKGVVIITADHGNAEFNFDSATGQKHTAHTASLVPCIVVGPDEFLTNVSVRDGALYDIAPTILGLLAVSVPQSMSGKSLVVSKK